MTKPLHIRWPYGVDESGDGFFCPIMHQKKRDYFALKLLRPVEAEAVYQCNPGAKTGSIFVEADFRYYDAPMGLELGVNNPFVRKWIESKGMIVAQGWDTAMSADSTADYSACVTIGMVPCEHFHREGDAKLLGECDQHYDVYVLHVYRKRLDIGDLVAAIREQRLLWNPERIVIEKKASGASAMQALANFNLPIEGVVPEENKRQRAINGGSAAGSTQSWFRLGRILFPQLPGMAEGEWLGPFVRELKDFTGDKGGRDDQVDAMVHVTNYAIREGSAGVQFPTGWQTPDQAEAQMNAPETSGAAAIFNALAALDNPDQLLADGLLLDPFADTCGRCQKFDKQTKHCRHWNRTTPAIAQACPAFDDGNNLLSFPRF